MSENHYSKKETVARREAALKRAFAMPHKPHKTPAKPKPRRGGSDHQQGDQGD